MCHGNVACDGPWPDQLTFSHVFESLSEGLVVRVIGEGRTVPALRRLAGLVQRLCRNNGADVCLFVFCLCRYREQMYGVEAGLASTLEDGTLDSGLQLR